VCKRERDVVNFLWLALLLKLALSLVFSIPSLRHLSNYKLSHSIASFTKQLTSLSRQKGCEGVKKVGGSREKMREWI
jgi:hypothetical protein